MHSSYTSFQNAKRHDDFKEEVDKCVSSPVSKIRMNRIKSLNVHKWDYNK